MPVLPRPQREVLEPQQGALLQGGSERRAAPASPTRAQVGELEFGHGRQGGMPTPGAGLG